MTVKFIPKQTIVLAMYEVSNETKSLVQHEISELVKNDVKTTTGKDAMFLNIYFKDKSEIFVPCGLAGNHVYTMHNDLPDVWVVRRTEYERIEE